MRTRRFLAAVPLLLVASGCTAGEHEDSRACTAPFVLSRVGGTDRHTDIFSASGQLEPIDRLTTDGESLQPSISPDGRRIAYVNGLGSPWSSELGSERRAVFVMDIDGGRTRRLSHGEQDSAPSWAPDGKHVVFQRSGDDLVVASAGDGSEQTIGVGMAPSWSPMGDLVAFTHYDVDVGTTEVWVTRPDGSGRRAVAETLGGPASWSPDGTRLAFTAVDDATAQDLIQVVDVRSGEIVEVPRSRSAVTSVITWTSDDNLLFVRNVRGPDVEIVTSKSGKSRAPEHVATSSEDIYNLQASDNPVCGP